MPTGGIAVPVPVAVPLLNPGPDPDPDLDLEWVSNPDWVLNLAAVPLPSVVARYPDARGLGDGECGGEGEFVPRYLLQVRSGGGGGGEGEGDGAMTGVRERGEIGVREVRSWEAMCCCCGWCWW
jgi:hypothetical protein